MRVAIRLDASTAMGLGHLKRCLSLGKALCTAGATVSFVTRPLGLDAAGRLRQHGMHVLELSDHLGAFPAPVEVGAPCAAWAGVDPRHDAQETCTALLAYAASWDWVVVDSYAFDARWHRAVSTALGSRLCVIDDLADRTLESDLLVDHNHAADHRAKYEGCIRPGTRILGGPRFALLDPAYEHAARHVVRAEVGSIGVFMGGTDPWNASSVAVRACRGSDAKFEGPIEIATTAANPHLAELQSLCDADEQLSLVIDEPDLTAFFARHDLQIGAGGGAVWERCCIGAPTIAMVLAENHRASLDALSAAGAVRRVASSAVPDLGVAIAELIADANARIRLSSRARGFVDGRGARRVALTMLASTVDFRRATQEDAVRVFDWRNAEITRRHFRDPSPLELGAHIAWWKACLDAPQRRLVVAHCGAIDVGVLRLDLDITGTRAEVSLYLDPALHGLGLGSALLIAAQTWTVRNEPAIERLVAEVLPDNAASHAAFRAAGFEPSATTHHWNWPPSQ